MLLAACMEAAYSSIGSCKSGSFFGPLYCPPSSPARPSLGSAQQQPAPSATFQVEVNFVDIDAVVTDERGNFVSDLTKDDFELLDDGKPQEISAFSLVDIPMPSASARAARVPRRR